MPKLLARSDVADRALSVRAVRKAAATVRSQVDAPAVEQAIAGVGRYQVPVGGSGNWYDVTVTGDGFEQRYAGRIEDGRPHTSDPAVGI